MASDRLIKSVGSPEGFIEAPTGTYYLNTQSFNLYVKLRGDATTKSGWFGLICKGYYTCEGNPEGKIVAPRMAYCLDEDSDTLYVQMTDSLSPIEYGWLPVNTGQMYNLAGDPIAGEVSGKLTDIYIDSENGTISIYTETGWQRMQLLTVNDDDILVNLSELLTNVTEICNTYFNMFINTEPMDISVSQYNEKGLLETYVIPNRAKDRQVAMGYADPNGNLASAIGTLYMQQGQRALFIKTTDESASDGWKPLIYGGKIEEPLYLDDNGMLKIRMDNIPTDKSQNLINSSVLFSMFETKADKNGNENENFKVAYATENKDAVNLECLMDYLNGTFNEMFTYDSDTRTLKISTQIKKA